MSELAKCPLCQKYIDITFVSETCPKCGGNIADANLKPESYRRFNGVGGWLLFLCISLTILGPLLNIPTILSEIQIALQIGEQYPQVYTVVIIEVIYMTILILFGIYAGISLWTIRPKAVSTAKLYLMLLPIITIFGIGLTYFLLPAENRAPFINQSIFLIFRTLIYSGIWFTYLSNSQRVAETYLIE